MSIKKFLKDMYDDSKLPEYKEGFEEDEDQPGPMGVIVVMILSIFAAAFIGGMLSIVIPLWLR
jgi:hypothetical protein